MADELTARYGDLLTGTYDCVDPVVLNAYFSMGHSPGGFRTWWRRWHWDDDDLDNTHLMRLAGRLLAGFGGERGPTVCRSSTPRPVIASI